MPVKVIYKNKRSGMDRRKSLSLYNGTERRSGVDRRQLKNKLKRLIEIDAKDQDKKKQILTSQRSGNVILRKKDE